MTQSAAQAGAATPLSTKAEAEALLARLSETMDALTHVLEAETTLVRAGKLMDAGRLTIDKAELARRYAADMMAAQTAMPDLKRLAPERVSAMVHRHDRFRAELQINMTVLATAKALAESLVQEIGETIARQDRPLAYGQTGAQSEITRKTARPVAMNKTV